MRFLLTTVLLFSMYSCQSQEDSNNKRETDQMSPTVEYLTGRYDIKADAWITEDSNYTSHKNTVGTTIYFDGKPYAFFTKMEDYDPIGSGLIDKEGKIIIPPLYSGISSPFINSICEVTKDNLIGFINEQGVVIAAPQYEFSDFYHNREEKITYQIDTTIIIVSKDGLYD